MTHAHTVLSRLRQRGYRITPQRELIIEALVDSSDHVTAEALHARVQEHTAAINIATVYRTLDMLVEEGLATRAGLLEGQLSYAPKIHGAHLHLICRFCHHSLNADESLLDMLEQQLSERYHFAADFHHLTLFGVCHACQAEYVTIFEEE